MARAKRQTSGSRRTKKNVRLVTLDNGDVLIFQRPKWVDARKHEILEEYARQAEEKGRRPATLATSPAP